MEYGIQEKFVVDNKLSKVYSKIKSIEEIEKKNEFLWIITCSDPIIHDEIIKSLDVSQDKIIDIFKEACSKDEPNDMQYQIVHLQNKAFGLNVVANEVIECIKKAKGDHNCSIDVAEIGIGVGTTSVAICKELSSKDTYSCFDFSHIVGALLHDLSLMEFITCKVRGYGNTQKEYDSYHWTLSQLALDMKNNGSNGLFDVVYLDGAHDFLHDALACCMLKKLLKPQGYIIFDDVHWTWESYFIEVANDEMRNWISSHYTDEQMKSCQIQRILQIFMDNDTLFKCLSLPDARRAVYQKIR